MVGHGGLIEIHSECAQRIVAGNGRLANDFVERLGARFVEHKGIDEAKLNSDENQQDANQKILVAIDVHRETPLVGRMGR